MIGSSFVSSAILGQWIYMINGKPTGKPSNLSFSRPYSAVSLVSCLLAIVLSFSWIFISLLKLIPSLAFHEEVRPAAIAVALIELLIGLALYFRKSRGGGTPIVGPRRFCIFRDKLYPGAVLH